MSAGSTAAQFVLFYTVMPQFSQSQALMGLFTTEALSHQFNSSEML